MLTLRELSVSRGTQILLDKVSLVLQKRQKVGLVGHNGCGKSTFFSLLLRELTPDTGQFELDQTLRMSHLSQQLPETHEPALTFVLSGDTDYIETQRKLEKAESSGDHDTIMACHHKLSEIDGYSKPAIAAKIMAGLGFSPTDTDKPVSAFSGGYQMRLNLARCLMTPADFLLLDEPTNHLDLEALCWLEKWLQQLPITLIIISHDREFLDAIVTHIVHIDRQKMILYKGSYSQFEILRGEQLALQQSTHEAQQKKIEHLMSFVNRFRAKATKAKQAQSRLRAIDKMVLIAKAQADSPFSFEFFETPALKPPLIYCEGLTAGYDEAKPILKNVHLVINPQDRIALLGPNGQGKSTLIKTLTGELPPLAGEVVLSPRLRIGYYAQHQLDALDMTLTPVQTIQVLSPTTSEQTIRDFLGGFAFTKEMAMHPITHFSGGEKARLALAKLVWQKPDMLLLDEPTNHLDLDMRMAITEALQAFDGGVILITHDRHLLRHSVDTYYLVYQQAVRPFNDTLEAYEKFILQKNREMTSPKPVTTKEKPASSRQTSQKEMKQLEQQITQLTTQLKDLDNTLIDTLPTADNWHRLGRERKQIELRLHEAEERWFLIAGDQGQ